jgi:non-canonical (house-cleaning) NTP pyrophosphatase
MKNTTQWLCSSVYARSMKITFCGSMYHIEGMRQASEALEKLNYEVEIPNPRAEEVDYHSLSDVEQSKLKNSTIKEHLDKITESDAILIFNEEKKGVKGYIGGNTLMEMAFAYAQGIEIFLWRPAPDLSYKDEVLGILAVIVDGDVSILDAYFKKLPRTFVSSKSPIKLRAVSRGMRRAGIRTQVLPHPTESNVAEQPRNIEETYKGAMNRHAALKASTLKEKPEYIATVEGGLHQIHPNHNLFSSTVVILEKAGNQPKAGMNVEIEFPKEMTDKIPSVYPDLGVLVQQEYGSTLKDPFPYFTGGKVNRLQLVETAVFNVAVQLPAGNA